MAMFFVVERRTGPKWDPSQPLEGQSGWLEHAAFMDALVDDGVVSAAHSPTRVVSCSSLSWPPKTRLVPSWGAIRGVARTSSSSRSMPGPSASTAEPADQHTDPSSERFETGVPLAVPLLVASTLASAAAASEAPEPCRRYRIVPCVARRVNYRSEPDGARRGRMDNVQQRAGRWMFDHRRTVSATVTARAQPVRGPTLAWARAVVAAMPAIGNGARGRRCSRLAKSCTCAADVRRVSGGVGLLRGAFSGGALQPNGIVGFMSSLPTGTVTFLFTDIEGSTRLLQELGERYREVLSEHRRLIREAFDHWDGQ